MAAAFPDVVRSALDDPTEAAGARLAAVRAALEASGQFIAAAKEVLRLRGVPVRDDVRAPLRPLTTAEAEQLETAIGAFLDPRPV